MSKKRRQHRSRSASRGRKRSTRSSTSLVIPIIVGFVVVAIVVGGIIFIENRQPATAAVPGDSLATNSTAQPLPTSSIPFPFVPRTTLQEAQDKLEAGQAILVDVRSKQSYDQSHAVGAVSIPEGEIDSRMDELPTDVDLVLY